MEVVWERCYGVLHPYPCGEGKERRDTLNILRRVRNRRICSVGALLIKVGGESGEFLSCSSGGSICIPSKDFRRVQEAVRWHRKMSLMQR